MDQPGTSRQADEADNRARIAYERIKAIRERCTRTAHLDGRFFEVDQSEEEQDTADNTIVGICKICPSRTRIRGRIDSASNFKSHLKRRHADVYDEYALHAATKRLKLQELDMETGKKAACVFSQTKFERNVAEYVLQSAAPYSTVEMPSFRQIFNDLKITLNETPLKHISRRKLVRIITDVYRRNVDDLKQTLAASEIHYVCTTADIWTCSTRRFLGVTVHWIDPASYERRSAAIACRRFSGTHSYIRIGEVLSDVHKAFGIENKVVGTITDNASNFVKAFQEFGVDGDAIVDSDINSGTTAERDETETEGSDTDSEDIDDADEEESFNPQEACLTESNLAFEEELPRHFRCVCHTLNLVATADVAKILKAHPVLHKQHELTISKCNILWRVLRSPKQREILTGILGQSLSRPVVVRWNSLYNSLRQIVNLKSRIIEASRVLNLSDQLNTADFCYIDEYLTCLKPIADTLERLQGEKYCFYGFVTPSIISLRRNILQTERNSRVTICQNLARELAVAIDNRFRDYIDIIGNGEFAAISAVLHPRFKKIWVSSLPADKRDIVDRATSVAVNSHGVSRELHADEDLLDADFFNFEPAIPEPPSGISNMSVIDIELLKYLNEPPSNSLKILDAFPSIKKAFMYYNTILPSSAPVERLFSYATMMALPRYNRLTDRQFEMRVISKCNGTINRTE